MKKHRGVTDVHMKFQVQGILLHVIHEKKCNENRGDVTRNSLT